MDNQNEQAAKAALMQRDALMTLLIAQATGLIQQLALLAASEKVAVTGLVAIGQAMAIYVRSANPDPQVVASFDRVLGTLSPSLDSRSGVVRARQACVERSGVSRYSHAPSELFERRASPETISETASVTQYLKALLAAMPVSPDGRQRQPDDPHPALFRSEAEGREA